MKAFFLLPLLLVAFATPSLAFDYGIVGGLNFSNPSQDTSFPGGLADGTESAIGGQLGLAVYIDLVEDFSLRTGAELGYRNIESDTSLKYHFLSLDIPVYVQYSFTESVSAFMGPKLIVNLNTTCDGANNCEVRGEDVPTLSIPFAIGGVYKLNDKMAIEAFYEIALTPIYDLQGQPYSYELWMDTFGANFIYMF